MKTAEKATEGYGMDKSPQAPAATAGNGKSPEGEPRQMAQATPKPAKAPGATTPATPQMGGQIFKDWASI